jgi:hypothetical protein
MQTWDRKRRKMKNLQKWQICCLRNPKIKRQADRHSTDLQNLGHPNKSVLMQSWLVGLSLYQGVFNILKITTTTHNDINCCISFNSKSAHSNPPIFLYMQKEDSLSFPIILGSGGRGWSLLNEMVWCTPMWGTK